MEPFAQQLQTVMQEKSHLLKEIQEVGAETQDSLQRTPRLARGVQLRIAQEELRRGLPVRGVRRGLQRKVHRGPEEPEPGGARQQPGAEAHYHFVGLPQLQRAFSIGAVPLCQGELRPMARRGPR